MGIALGEEREGIQIPSCPHRLTRTRTPAFQAGDYRFDLGWGR